MHFLRENKNKQEQTAKGVPFLTSDCLRKGCQIYVHDMAITSFEKGESEGENESRIKSDMTATLYRPNHYQLETCCRQPSCVEGV